MLKNDVVRQLMAVCCHVSSRQFVDRVAFLVDMVFLNVANSVRLSKLLDFGLSFVFRLHSNDTL